MNVEPRPIKKTCLNGWWDFFPGDGDGSGIPERGWLERRMLVPSFWTQSLRGVRRKGERLYRALTNVEYIRQGGYEFLFDGFGYPPEWTLHRTGWLRRRFEMEAPPAGRRYSLHLEGVMPKGILYVNGHRVCEHIHPTLPLTVEVGTWLCGGENEIAVRVEDYDRDDSGRALVPTGNTIPCEHRGIWQDVWLEERSEIYLADVTLRSSVREKRLEVLFEIHNGCSFPRRVRVDAKVVDVEGREILRIATPEREVGGGETIQETVRVAWPVEAGRWDPESPVLHWIHSSLVDGETVLETTVDRFGFREVWIEGPDLILNGYPIHLFSDWGHKFSPFYTTEAWIRKWYGMIRDANMNHSRLHTHPHAPIHLDIADELGILITGETGLHGSGGAQAAGSFAYWEAARDHVRRFVRRDKNHPSLILWSVENEMRWNNKQDTGRVETQMLERELPKLRALFEELDPTRPAYHDGDSSLWNEQTQTMLSRHYGKEVSGIGWWDQTRPLHSGEMGLYHFASPATTLHLGGDGVFAKFAEVDRWAGQDAAWILETARTLGVCCLGPWNLSCLENLRMETADTALDIGDPTAPGMKPLRVSAHASEFSFWREGKGYTPNKSFDLQARAFRPFAVIDRSLKTSYFTESHFNRELFVVNDSASDQTGELCIRLSQEGETLMEQVHPLRIPRGTSHSVSLRYTMPRDVQEGGLLYEVSFRSGEETLDKWSCGLRLSGPIPRLEGIPEAALFGGGNARPMLDRLGVQVRTIDVLNFKSLEGCRLLILDRYSVIPGSRQNVEIADFARRGGRVIVLEQMHSLFPGLTLEEKPVLCAFVRSPGHPVLAGLNEDDFRFWGEDPYPLLANDGYVSLRMYRKDDGRQVLPILDSGEGGFGHGDLEYTPLCEIATGKGLVLACQLRLHEKSETEPAAMRVLANLLRTAEAYNPPEVQRLHVAEGGGSEGLSGLLELAHSGATVLVERATPEALRVWGEGLGVPLRAVDGSGEYQLVRVKEDALLNGVSNDDTCGIETYPYAPAGSENHSVAEWLLVRTPGLESLLETPTESALRELMVEGGRSEALRAHTLSRFLYAERSEARVGLGVVRYGKGRVLFSQTTLNPNLRKRFGRLPNRLRANLGHLFERHPLEGERVPDAAATGPGFPESVYVLDQTGKGPDRSVLLESTRPTFERMLTMPILNTGGWQAVEGPDGEWRASDLPVHNPFEGVYLYYPLWSPSPRKNLETNLEVPNPEALTFLDLEGCGRVELVLNGHVYPAQDLAEGSATFSDLGLEMGGNHVLLHWYPPSPDARLRMRWRNIMRQAEINFAFGSGGSAH